MQVNAPAVHVICPGMLPSTPFCPAVRLTLDMADQTKVDVTYSPLALLSGQADGQFIPFFPVPNPDGTTSHDASGNPCYSDYNAFPSGIQAGSYPAQISAEYAGASTSAASFSLTFDVTCP